MKCGNQYPASEFAVKALHLLFEHPGLTAAGFAALCWPYRKGKVGWIGALKLWHLVQRGWVKTRFEPPCWKAGPIKPRKRYYITGQGFAVHEYYARQRYSKDGHTPNGDRARRPRNGADPIGRAQHHAGHP